MKRMKVLRRLHLLALLLLPLCGGALAQAERDLVLELREIEEGASGYSVGTRPATPLMPLQRLRVRNGEAATLSNNTTTPYQWVKQAQAAGPQGGAGVERELVWVQTGRTLQLQPEWDGKKTVIVSVQVQSAAAAPEPGRDLPGQQRGEVVTRVTVPLGQWVTLARSGGEYEGARKGAYSSDGAAQRARLLQIRVTAP